MKAIEIKAGIKASDVTIDGESQRLYNDEVLTLIYIHEAPLSQTLKVFSPGDRSAKRAFWAGRFLEAGDAAGMKTEMIWEG